MKKGVLFSKAIGQTGFMETQLLICDNFVLQFNGYKVVRGINFCEQDVKSLEKKDTRDDCRLVHRETYL